MKSNFYVNTLHWIEYVFSHSNNLSTGLNDLLQLAEPLFMTLHSHNCSAETGFRDLFGLISEM